MDYTLNFIKSGFKTAKEVVKHYGDMKAGTFGCTVSDGVRGIALCAIGAVACEYATDCYKEWRDAKKKKQQEAELAVK